MHTFLINGLIQLYFLRHVSNTQFFVLRKASLIKHTLPSTRLLIWIREKYHKTVCTSLT